MAMETVLEQQRRFHEERERLADALVKEILHKKGSVSTGDLAVLSLDFSVWHVLTKCVPSLFFSSAQGNHQLGAPDEATARRKFEMYFLPVTNDQKNLMWIQAISCVSLYQKHCIITTAKVCDRKIIDQGTMCINYKRTVWD